MGGLGCLEHEMAGDPMGEASFDRKLIRHGRDWR
jgi:hypothetical protein